MTTETILKVPDIVCGGCADSIKNALGRMDGIEEIKVDVERKTVAVEHGEQISRANLEAALDDIGFTAA